MFFDIDRLLVLAIQRYEFSGKFVDVKILRCNQTIAQCHKVILAACSTYFDNLLKNVEGNTILKLDNVDEALCRFLPTIINFIYGRPVTIGDSQLDDFGRAAKVFGVGSLCKLINSDSSAGISKKHTSHTFRPLAYGSLLLVVLQKFLSSGSYVDTELVCENGHRLRAHRLVLGATSPYFENLLLSVGGGMARVLIQQNEAVLCQADILDLLPSNENASNQTAHWSKQIDWLIGLMYGQQKAGCGDSLASGDYKNVIDVDSLRHFVKLFNLTLPWSKIENLMFRRKNKAKKRTENATKSLKSVRSDLESVTAAAQVKNNINETCSGIIYESLHSKLSNKQNCKEPSMRKSLSSKLIQSPIKEISSKAQKVMTSLKSRAEVLIDVSELEKSTLQSHHVFGIKVTTSTESLTTSTMKNQRKKTMIKMGIKNASVFSKAESIDIPSFVSDTQNSIVVLNLDNIDGFNQIVPNDGAGTSSTLLQNAESSTVIQNSMTLPTSTTTVCQKCYMTFSNMAYKHEHMANVHGEKEFVCQICYKKVEGLINFISHWNAHIADRKAGKVPTKKRNRPNKSDFTTTAQKINEVKLMCHHCGKCFQYPSVLARHISNVHLQQDRAKIFSCCHCGHMTNDKYSLEIHIKSLHTKIKRFSCEHCPYKSVTSSQMSRHRKIHTGEHCHQCASCNRSFVEKRDLMSHTAMYHTKVALFNCTLCASSFYRKDKLRMHMKNVHRNENDAAKNEAARLEPIEVDGEHFQMDCNDYD